MFCPYKNSYLQLVCAVNPRVINKAVDQAMQKTQSDPHSDLPPAQRLESMQPSLFAPHVDITRARVGFGRTGLRILIRDLHSHDNMSQLQALHSIMDKAQISEDALYMIDHHVVYRLIDLMHSINPIIREKVCMIFTILSTYFTGRTHILYRPEIIDNLMWLCLRDRKEIRYAAAYTLRTLSRHRCSCEAMVLHDRFVGNLLKMVINDHVGIVILHLRTLENLIDWNPEHSLKCNAFQVMLSLFSNDDERVVSAAMDCMAQLLQHEIGRELADMHDLTFVLRPFLKSPNIELIISAVSLLKVTTLTTRSKWRAKECCNDLTKQLVNLCTSHNKPMLQLNCMQVLINLCDCPDIRYHLKKHLEKRIRSIRVRTHEEWDGTTETTSYGLETGHNYRTMCIEKVETIKNEFGDSVLVVNVHSYLRTVRETKLSLLEAINWKSYRTNIGC